MSLAPASHSRADGPDRAARALKETPGVTGVAICSAEGDLLSTADAARPDTSREAALATFACRRGEALTMDGDLRGMGKLVAGSGLRHIVWSGPRGDAVCIPWTGHVVFAACQPGAAGEALLASAGLIVRRYL